jgi:transmembrane sensor
MTDHEGENVERVVASARRAGLPWSPARQQRVSWAVMSRIEGGRRRRPVIALACAGAVAAAACLFVWHRRPAAPGATTVAVAAPDWQLASSLADGTRIVREDASTVLRQTVEEPDDVLFELQSGGASFEVARRPSRVFRVHAGEVTVQVIGTGFRVRRTGARCQVAVEHGRVLVSWWGGSRELGVGEQGTFPPETPAGAPPVAAEPAAPPAASLPASVSSASVPTPPIHTGRRAAASAVAAGPEALFARADRARAEGNPALAVATLRELREQFPRAPQAGAAAFTRGRLLLESLHRPREAAVAFAEARALARGDGTLAEDALAREVEALRAAGDTASARARAELYRSSYPHGLRLQIVERYGGLLDRP